MNPIFKREPLQTEFEEKGYVTLPFLDKSEVEELKSFYRSLEVEGLTGFHASMYNPDVALRQQANEKLKSVIGKKLDDILNGYQCLYANFMVKEGGVESEMKVHQDWTYVDEDKYDSLAIWFPLIDLNHDNGGLYMMPGSYKVRNTIRGYGIPCPFDALHEEIKNDYLELAPLNAGDAVIWQHRTVHYSPANLSAERRIAGTGILVPQGAEVYHYYRAADHPVNSIEKFRVNEDFYMNYKLGQRPEGVESCGMIEYEFAPLQHDDLPELYGSQEKQKPRSVIERIKQLFI